ncbi:hypothetical protein M0802_014605 [Mischocyttarus mexicanus]|nr:hypothetical protein M0802_014605 [Mischocyttarus mexicanus]
MLKLKLITMIAFQSITLRRSILDDSFLEYPENQRLGKKSRYLANEGLFCIIAFPHTYTKNQIIETTICFRLLPKKQELTVIAFKSLAQIKAQLGYKLLMLKLKSGIGLIVAFRH